MTLARMSQHGTSGMRCLALKQPPPNRFSRSHERIATARLLLCSSDYVYGLYLLPHATRVGHVLQLGIPQAALDGQAGERYADSACLKANNVSRGGRAYSTAALGNGSVPRHRRGGVFGS